MAKTILIVDDSNTARASVEYTLKKDIQAKLDDKKILVATTEMISDEDIDLSIKSI